MPNPSTQAMLDAFDIAIRHTNNLHYLHTHYPHLLPPNLLAQARELADFNTHLQSSSTVSPPPTSNPTTMRGTMNFERKVEEMKPSKRYVFFSTGFYLVPTGEVLL